MKRVNKLKNKMGHTSPLAHIIHSGQLCNES